jgi:serine/threonine protein kinase
VFASTKSLGRYTLLEQIARGGMAQVFLAQRDGAATPCVLKQLHVELEDNPTAGKRFQREANIASRLRHTNIASVISAGIEDGTFCIGMELIAGQTVEALVVELARRNERVPADVTIRILLEVLDGAAYAHALTDEDGTALNIVHRDLSPRNIMVAFDGAVKIIDFGVARGRIDAFQTAPGMMVGTLRYMSPEQAMAEGVDRRSDLYTLGVVLHEMLSGAPAITNTRAVDVLNRVIAEPLPPLSEVAPHVPAAVGDVVAKATAKNPDDRFADADQMRAALAAAFDAPADDAALGALVRRLFPEHVKRTQGWADEARASARMSDALEHDTLTEATAPSLNHETLPMITPPPRVESVRNRRTSTPRIERRSSTPKIADLGSDPPPRGTSKGPSLPTPVPDPASGPPSNAITVSDAPTPRGVSRVRPTSRLDASSDARIRALEKEVHRWRNAFVLLLLVVTGALSVLAWIVSRS